ncbi:hypothetical protein [Sulfurimonas sp.]|uniref:hypothetical protein n=1 Tax=Sulfurimonas sp. TaxID=2022749 RepID=UPI002AB2BF67|nr:hypothetical protein [Sulfurimonas sp.]
MKQISTFALDNKVDIRLGIDQNIYLLGLSDTSTPFASPAQSATIITCAGSLCPYSFWSIKNETKYLPLDKISKHGITVGFSGCIKGCGRHRHTDIGLVGLKTNNFGNTDGGARVFVGAVHTDGLSISRMLFSMVPLVHLHKTIDLIIKLYELSGYSNFEEFSDAILNKFSEEFLALWVLANLQTNQAIKLEPTSSGFEYEKNLLKETFSEVDFIEPLEEKFAPSVSALSKKLWTVAGADPVYKPKLNRVNFR